MKKLLYFIIGCMCFTFVGCNNCKTQECVQNDTTQVDTIDSIVCDTL